MRNPTILISGLSENLEENTIIESIKNQNNFEFRNIKVIKVYQSFKNRSIYNVLVEIDNEAFKQMMDEKFVYIKYDRCVMYEKVNVRRCFKCLGFNHKIENCTSEKICYKCGETNHEVKECTSEIIKCINCSRVKTKTNFDNINVDHDTRSIDCPAYRRQLQSERSKINY